MSRFLRYFLVMTVMLPLPAHADNGLATAVNWQTTWGNILPSTGIPLAQHSIKKDISDTVQLCGISKTTYDLVKVSTVDFTGDGLADYIVDETAYFKDGQSSTCDTQICTTDGCQMALYAASGASQIKTPDSRATQTVIVDGKETVQAVACPATADANTGCRTDCDATVALCPALFNYPSKIIWVGTQTAWAFISPDSFATIRAKTYAADGTTLLYSKPYNTNPIYQVKTTTDKCTNEELTKTITHKTYSDGRRLQDITTVSCTKYYQYINGTMRDLYNPQDMANGTGDENDSRIAMQDASTLKSFPAASGADTLVVDPETGATRSQRQLYKRSTSIVEDEVAIAAGDTSSSWRVNGQKFFGSEGGTTAMALQIKNFTAAQASDPSQIAVKSGSSATSVLCDVITSTSKNALFVPTKTDAEYQSFRQAISAGNVPGVSLSICTPKFTTWQGTTSCPTMSCGVVQTIAAERHCVRPTGAYGDCSECANVTDANVLTSTLTGTSSKGLCFFTQTCYNKSCPTWHHSCFAPETKILMSDNSLKSIKEIVAGDRVMAFKQHKALAILEPATVQAVVETNDKELVMIDDMKITPNHLMMLKGGKMIEAGKVHAGTKLIDASGKVTVVKKVATVAEKAKVYNLSLEDADGYVADGVRVQSFPAHQK